MNAQGKTYSHLRAGAASGFSLLEIMIVVVLMGLIVAFAANRILGGADKAKFNLAKSSVQTLAGKIEQYELDTGSLPSSLQDLVTSPAGNSGWLGPYAKESELKDPWNQPYEYSVPGESTRFDLISYGSDAKPGGESTAQDIRND